MPNWCYNTLTIQGPKSEVDYIKDRLNAPFTLAMENHGMGDISSMGFPTKIKQVNMLASLLVVALTLMTLIGLRSLLSLLKLRRIGIRGTTLTGELNGMLLFVTAKSIQIQNYLNINQMVKTTGLSTNMRLLGHLL